MEEQYSVPPPPQPPLTTTTTLIATTFITLYLLYFLYLRHKFRGPVTLWPILGTIPGVFHNRNRLHDWATKNLTQTGPSLTYQTCSFPLPFFASTYGLYTTTCHPKNIEHVLKTRFDNYPKGPTWQESFYDLLGEGIFNSDGDCWRKQRKAAAPEFCTRTLRQALNRWVKQSIENRFWPILEEAALNHQAVDMQDLLLRLTFDNICGLTFGKDPNTLSPGLPETPFAKAFETATEITLQRLLYTPVVFKFKKMLKIGDEKELERSLKILDNYMSEVLHECEESPSDDLLSRFIKLRGIEGNYSSNSDLKHIAMNFILAGRDTSSVAMSWFFWLIMNNPEVEDKIVNEIKHVLKTTRGVGSDGVDHMKKWVEEPLVFDEADKLVYLKAALSESLRLYPSVPEDLKHVLKDDVLPDGRKVTGGSNVIYSIYAMGRMKEIWGEDCMEFKPERWLVMDREGEYRFEPPKEGFKFVAFNAGPRTCLGKDLAYLQMKCVTSAVLLRYKLSLVPGHRVEQKMALTLFMKNGLNVYLHPRDVKFLRS